MSKISGSDKAFLVFIGLFMISVLFFGGDPDLMDGIYEILMEIVESTRKGDDYEF